jgi:predicted ATPase
MAEVYLAHDPILDRQVAIKVILAHLAADEGFVARFRREAKTIASLRHPHIVQLFDFDVLHGQPFMVMEYLAGETLKVRLSALRTRGGRMPLNESVRLLAALAGALDYAHAQGAVHRDIKPANILFTGQGEPVLSDFGIAKLMDQTVQLSMAGGILGTPAYMSPEQARGQPVDERSDLYSLGVMAYELATGRLPFQGDSPSALLVQRLLEKPPPPRTFNPNLPAAVEQVILQALAKEPGERFASAGAFAQALRTALHGPASADVSPEDVTVVEPPPAAPPAAGSSPTAPARSLPVPPGRKGQPVERVTVAAGFVAREQELAQLAAWLERALAGQGQVCFVTGEAGAGKTALVTEFVHRAQGTHTDLLIVAANCNTQSGIGDPYLPFRELLSRLVGLTGEATLPEATGQPTGIRSRPGRALADHGPDLIDIFVPGDALLAQLAGHSATRSEWMNQLAMLVQRKAKVAGQETGVEQSHILEQYTNVLAALAAQQPLLLVVDDLQWIDVASADLLFHLSRRIGNSRILLLGTYRPDEVVQGRSGEEHLLAKVLAELKRYFGEIHVTLQQEDAEAGRRFVDSLLDREPNRLNVDFRQALFHHTGGHALFTVELLRTMQERGDLTQDGTGSWVAEPTLNWEQLPPRVEGVIEERIGRLAEELREVLTIASVEGEDFTAEVVARVQKMDERGIIRHLSRELDKHHRLVSAQGRQRVGRQHVSSYRFRHNLFQKYLYNQLDAVERAYFHEDVGTVLEELYGDTAGTIAVQLAWHFSEADLPEKARHYLAIAGEQARRRYANAEALSYFNRALDLTPEADHASRYTLLLARQKVFDVLGDRQAQRQDLVQLEELAEKLNDHRRQAEIALCQTLYAERIGEYREAIEYAQRAIELAAPIHDVEREAKGWQQWGRALLNLSNYPESQLKLQQALALAEAEQLHQVKADSLRALGVVAYFLGDYRHAAATYEQTLTIYREVGDRRGEGHTLSNLGLALREQGAYAGARRYFDQALQLYQEIGDRDGAAHVLNNLGLLCRDQGDHAASLAYYRQSLEICRQTGARNAEGLALLGIGDVYKDQEAFVNAASYYEQALLILRAIGDRREEHLALKELGNIALELGDYTSARAQYEEALACFRQIGDRQSESSTLNRLGLLYHQMGEEEAARANSQAALSIAQEIGDRWLESSSLTKLGHALAGLGDPDAASECYQKAVVLWRAQGRPDLALESVAGLARIALSRGDLPQAQTYAEEMLVQFDDQAFSNDGMAEEYLACYRVLRAAQDAQADELLRTVYTQLQASAAQIDDEAMRHSYLENVPAHRAIIGEWRHSAP